MKTTHFRLRTALALAWALGAISASGAVTLHPGDNIQALVTANPNNTTFVFSAGTYTNQSIIPKAGDVFDGQAVATLDGANAATRAFGGTVGNVTIKNLTIQHYSSALQSAAVDCGLGNAWTVSNCVVQLNTSVGLNFGTNSVIVNNQLNGNGVEGFSGAGNGWLMKNNQINNNNTSHQIWPTPAGGGRVTAAGSGTFDGNTVTNNDGPGIWLSSDANGIIVRSNVCIGNYSSGIMVEISRNNSISNNVSVGNGWVATNWTAAQILLSTAPSNTVASNILGVPISNHRLYGIFVMDESRTNGAGSVVHAISNEVYGNLAWFWNTNAGIQGCGTDESYPSYTNNHFYNNAYHVANTSVKYFSWDTNDTLAQAQAKGHEIGSTIDTNMTPRLGIATANNAVALYWPSWAINFQPWCTTNLFPATNWSLISNSIIVTNAQLLLSLGASNSESFFRLVETQDSLSVGLIAHYTFDEECTNAAAGCVRDYSGFGNNGTLGSATSGTNPQAPIWTPDGKFAGAYLYHGIVLPSNIVATVGQGIFLPQGVDVDGNWTLSLWGKLNNVTNHTSSTFYCQKQSTEDCRNLLIHWEGDMDQTMTLQVRDSACHELLLHNLPANPMVAGQWVHLVGVGSNKVYSFYINGALQQSQLVSNMGSLSCDFHGIGVMFDDFGRYYNHYLDGAVDELRIYNRALTPAEVLALYNLGGGVVP